MSALDVSPSFHRMFHPSSLTLAAGLWFGLFCVVFVCLVGLVLVVFSRFCKWQSSFQFLPIYSYW